MYKTQTPGVNAEWYGGAGTAPYLNVNTRTIVNALWSFDSQTARRVHALTFLTFTLRPLINHCVNV